MSLPPWLNINPLEPTRGFLQGFGQGAQVGTSRRVGEQQAAEFAQVQAFREAQSAAQQAQAAIANQLARERLEQQQAEFTATIRLKEKEAEREAAEAAEQALAMQQFRNDVRSGMNEAQAAARNPGIFGRSRAGLGSVISAMQRQSQAAETPMFVPEGGYGAPGEVPFRFRGDPSELVGTGAPPHFITGSGQVRFPPSRSTSTAYNRFDLPYSDQKAMEAKFKQVDNWFRTLPERKQQDDKTFEEYTKRIQDIEKEYEPKRRSNPSGGGVPVIKSKEEYDALPAGTIFKGSNGKTYRKK